MRIIIKSLNHNDRYFDEYFALAIDLKIRVSIRFFSGKSFIFSSKRFNDFDNTFGLSFWIE